MHPHGEYSWSDDDHKQQHDGGAFPLIQIICCGCSDCNCLLLNYNNLLLGLKLLSVLSMLLCIIYFAIKTFILSNQPLNNQPLT